MTSQPTIPDVHRFRILGVELTGTTLQTASKTIAVWAKEPAMRSVHIFAVDSILKAYDDPVLFETVNRADLVLTDGMPLVWLGKRRTKAPITRCYGPDVMLGVIREGCRTGVRHFLYGGADRDTVDRLRANFEKKFPGIRIVGDYVPPFRPLTEDEAKDVCRRIEESGAEIVWVGLGTPKQDLWIREFRNRIKTPVMIAVGAAFNFHAGTVRQAPRWMMRIGLEWLFRLAMEPRRLWKRYIVGNPRFVALVLREWLRNGK